MKPQPPTPTPSTARQPNSEWHMPLSTISNRQFSPPTSTALHRQLALPASRSDAENPLEQLFSDGSFLDAPPIAHPDIDPVLSLSLVPPPHPSTPPLTPSSPPRPLPHFRVPDAPPVSNAPPQHHQNSLLQHHPPQLQQNNLHPHHRKHPFMVVKDEPQIHPDAPPNDSQPTQPHPSGLTRHPQPFHSVANPAPHRFPSQYQPIPQSQPPPPSLQALQSADPDSLTPTERRRLRMYLRASRAGTRRQRPCTPDSNPSRPVAEISSSQVSSASNSTSFARMQIRNEANLPLVPVVPMKRESIVGTDKSARPAGVTKTTPHVDRTSANPAMDKKTARVIRNREVALRARQAAKAKLQNLESENSTLRTRATDLEMENSTLKMQIESLKRGGNSSWPSSELTLDNIVHAITP